MDALRSPVMFLLKDLMGDDIKGRYYKEQLRQAPTPGKDFDFEVKMCFIFYMSFGCQDTCNEECLFVVKCLIFIGLFVLIQIILKNLKLI